jgi:predicted  nucleic acid-binding Zn-ribbon protein
VRFPIVSLEFFFDIILPRKTKREIEVTRRRGRRRKKLLDDLKDRRGYPQLKEELYIALCGETVLEEALDLSSDRLLNE